MTEHLPDQGPEGLLEQVVATPWKAVNELRRLALWPAVWAYFAAHGVRWRRGWRIYGTPLIQRHRGSRIAAARGSSSGAGSPPTRLGCGSGACWRPGAPGPRSRSATTSA